MEEKNSGSGISPERRARINRMKRNIVIINFTILFTAIVCCILLFIRVLILSSEVERLEELLKQGRHNAVGEEKNEPETDVDDVPKETETKTQTGNVAESNKKVVYLTFDDGPSDNTYAILDVLDRYNVKATFFVNGKEGSTYEKAYKEIVKRGNVIGLHSYTHDFAQVYASVESFEADTQKLHDYIYGITGEDVKIYRFPGGSSTSKTTNIKQYIEYLDSQGYTYYDWNVSSGDAVTVPLSADTIVDNVMNGVRGRSSAMVLMHDSALKDTTVEALPIIIENLLSEGYEIQSIAETTPPVKHTVN